MKTAISLPNPLFEAAERLSRRLGVPRSRLYALALEAFLEAQRSRGVKERLDELYRMESSQLDPVLGRMQALSLWREEW